VIDALPETRLGRHKRNRQSLFLFAGQLVRSATSPKSLRKNSFAFFGKTCRKRTDFANYAEACAAESTLSFIHKLAIVLKELRESRVWIRLIVKTEILAERKMTDLEDESTQL